MVVKVINYKHANDKCVSLARRRESDHPLKHQKLWINEA